MKISSVLSIVLACCAPVACKKAETKALPRPTAPASASARWVPVEKPSGASLLEMPAVVRSDRAARGDIATLSRVRVLRVHVQVGSRVAAGAPVVDVVSPELLDAAGSRQAAAERARVHGERATALEALLSEGLVTQAQVFEQKTARRLAEAEKLAALGVLRGAGQSERDASLLLARGYFTLASPVDGVVTELEAYPGRTFEGGLGPLGRVVGEGPARIEVTAGRSWPPATALSFRSLDGKWVELDPAPISRVREPSDGTERLWFSPRVETRLPDGLTGIVRITAADDVFQVPAAAVAQTTGEARVFVQRGDGGEALLVRVVGGSGTSALVRGALALGQRVAAVYPPEGPRP